MVESNEDLKEESGERKEICCWEVAQVWNLGACDGNGHNRRGRNDRRHGSRRRRRACRACECRVSEEATSDSSPTGPETKVYGLFERNVKYREPPQRNYGPAC